MLGIPETKVKWQILLYYRYSFYELIFDFNVFEEETNKKIKKSFNHIISKDIYKWEKYIKTSCSNFLIIWRQNGSTENNSFIATMIYFNKTLKSLHFGGKFSFSYKF